MIYVFTNVTFSYKNNVQRNLLWASTCQTSGHDQLSMATLARNYQIGTILNLFIKTRKNYSFAVNSTESLYQLAIFLQFRIELYLNSVITSYALLYKRCPISLWI